LLRLRFNLFDLGFFQFHGVAGANEIAGPGSFPI
jgi:hypothetical protein